MNNGKYIIKINQDFQRTNSDYNKKSNLSIRYWADDVVLVLDINEIPNQSMVNY